MWLLPNRNWNVGLELTGGPDGPSLPLGPGDPSAPGMPGGPGKPENKPKFRSG